MGEKCYPGAQALIELHEIHLRRFLATWKMAQEKQVTLSETTDRAYRSFETLLGHVLFCACRYISWTADALGIPPPVLPELPETDAIADEADRLLEDILAAWRIPLWEQPLEAFVSGEHKAWWGTGYCVDAMLEHAVMHPLRHRWQLEKLMGNRDSSLGNTL